MEIVKIEKDIYVRDSYGVRRQVWVAGQEVKRPVYNAVLNTNSVVNPDDLPDVEPKAETLSFSISDPSGNEVVVETKELKEEPKTKRKSKKK